MFIPIVEIAAVAVATCVVFGLIRRQIRLHGNLKKVASVHNKASLKELLRRAEKGDLAAQHELESSQYRWSETATFGSRRDKRLRARLEEVAKQVRLPLHYDHAKQKFRGRLRAITASQTADDLDSQLITIEHIIAALDYLHHDWDYTETRDRLVAEFDVSIESLRVALQSQIQTAYALAVEEAPTKRDAFLSLRKLQDTAERYRSPSTPKLPFPDGWNEMVARYFENPVLSDFDVVKSPKAGDLRILAAEVVYTTSNFTDAKIILAYCNLNYHHHTEVGDTLISALAKLVVEKKASADVSYQ